MVGANAAHAALGLSPHAAVTLGSTIGGALLAVFTELTNLPLQALARRLTALENHRTQTAHDDALTLKVSLFLLTNSYAPLLYVALVQATGRVHSPLSGALEYCHDRADFASSQAEIEAAHGGGNPYCMHEMHTLLMSLVLTSQVLTLPYPTLPYPTLPYLTLPYLTLASYLTLPCIRCSCHFCSP